MTSLAQLPSVIGSRAVEEMLSGDVIDEVWKHVIDRVAAHSLDTFVTLLKK